MLRLAANRLLWSIPLLFAVSAITFVLLAVTPGDPTIAILGDHAPREAYVHLRQELGLNDPIYAQYGHWLSNAVQGNFGTSLFTSEPVTSTLGSRLPVTMSLMAVTIVVATLIGVGLGVLAAARGGRIGRAIDVVSLVGTAIPNYWLALVLVALFAVGWQILPATGYVAFTESPADWARSLALPTAVLVAGSVALLAKQTRDAMRDALGRDFITMLRAHGVSERSIIFKHALRNAAIPIITAVGFVFVGMLGGTIIVESVFVLPGLGSLAVQATMRHDVPVVQGVALCFTVLVVVVNLVIDLAYGWLNPRARAS